MLGDIVYSEFFALMLSFVSNDPSQIFARKTAKVGDSKQYSARVFLVGPTVHCRYYSSRFHLKFSPEQILSKVFRVCLLSGI